MSFLFLTFEFLLWLFLLLFFRFPFDSTLETIWFLTEDFDLFPFLDFLGKISCVVISIALAVVVGILVVVVVGLVLVGVTDVLEFVDFEVFEINGKGLAVTMFELKNSCGGLGFMLGGL